MFIMWMHTKTFVHGAASSTMDLMSLVLLVPAGLLVAATVARAGAPAEFTIDVSSLASMPVRQYHAMIHEANEVWRPYGVSLLWISNAADSATRASDRVLTVSRADAQAKPASLAAPRLGAVVFVEGHVRAERTLTLSIATIECLVDATPLGGRYIGE